MTQKLIARRMGASRTFLVALASTLAMFAFASSASAEVTYDYEFGSAGTGGGQFNEPASIAQNTSTGNLYIADRQNHRIQEFTENGAFLQAWGFDVVESGVDNKPFVDEVQRITVRAVAGTFTLTYGGQTTAPLAYNASAAAVAAALNALPAINGTGSVGVTGGPGDSSGSSPYVVTFGGGLGQGDRAQLVIDRSQLASAVGTELKCEGVGYWISTEGHFDYQWLRSGQPITGATSPAYTTTAADTGKAVQCEVTAWHEQTAPFPKTRATNPDYTMIGSIPAPMPPAPPAEIDEPEVVSGDTGTFGGGLASPGEGGTLKCDAGSWGNSPTEYTYQWFFSPRTPEAFTAPKTTASTSDELTLSEEDVTKRVLIQCKVTATNATGSTTMWSNYGQTEPGPPRGGLYNYETPDAQVTFPAGATAVSTQVNGGPVFETCKSGTNDVCKAGVPGPGMGQFRKPRGVAVDNSPGGNGAVYVGDDKNYRIQKLSEDGDPIFEIGNGVNQTTGGNFCSVASGDDCYTARTEVCQYGSECPPPDLSPGAFGGWWCFDGCYGIGVKGPYDELGNTVAVNESNGNLYVTDPNEIEQPWEPRIQAFDSSGQFIGQTQLPVGISPEPEPTAIAVNSQNQVLSTYAFDGNKRAVEIIEESEFTPEGTRKGYSERNQLHESGVALHVSGDPTSNKLWLVDKNQNDYEYFGNPPSKQVCGPPETSTTPLRRGLLAYDNEGHLLDCTVPQGPGAITTASGLVVSADAARAYVPIRKSNIVKVFKLPQPSLPAAQGGFVDAVTEHSASFHGEASPGFEATEIGFEYGTVPCSSNPGACSILPDGKIYGLKMQSFELSFEGLQANTKYYYRVVATNDVGTVHGPERTFTTYRAVDLINDPCPNVLARKQTRTAGALDCRAYELASAGFTGGYDVTSDLAPGQTPFEGYPAATNKLLYSVQDGGIPGTGKPTNRGPDPYVAVRDEATEQWVTKYVGIPSDISPQSPPFSSTPTDVDSSLSTFAFAGPDLCDPCFGDGSSGIPVHMPDGSLIQGMAGDPAAEPVGYVREHLSDDGSHLVFGSEVPLAPGGLTGELSIYSRDLNAGVTSLVSTAPGGGTMKEEGQDLGVLDVSSDGSRVLFGKIVGEDAAGRHWKLYMNIGGASESIDVTPGATSVLFGGMSSDGSRVFFSTRDELAGDSDESADVFEAQVPASGAAAVKVISGAPSDSCDPSGSPNDWNVPSGVGKCDAVALAGGAGVAPDGTAYFLSPQLLDGGNGEADAANLYVVRPGDSSPSLVATIDGPALQQAPPPAHPVVDPELITGLSGPGSLAVNQSDGNIYVQETGSSSVSRWTSAGAAANFTAGPNAGTNELTGQEFVGEALDQIAVDSSGGLMGGNLYTTAIFSGAVKVYANTGAPLGELTGIEFACGVAVENSTGAVYVSEPFGPRIKRFMPTSAPGPGVSNANYSLTSIKTEGPFDCQLSADDEGRVYASGAFNGVTKRYLASEFDATDSLRSGVTLQTQNSSQRTYADPANGELHINNGSKVLLFDSAGTKVKEYGQGNVSGHGGVAVNGGEGPGQAVRAHHSYAVNGDKVVEFGVEPDTFEPVEEPAVVNAVNDHDTHRWTDFQTSTNGRYALFATKQMTINPEYDSGEFRMIYRYDSETGAVDCVTCIPTEARPSANAALPSRGSGITNGGGAFFNSLDPLVPRDSNQKLDAYEWSPPKAGTGGCEVAAGCQALVSTGYSSFPSSMLGVSDDGVDAFFFTREVLVPSDQNGQTMKIYDARSFGGFFKLPNSPPCAASDECHGPSSRAADPLAIGGAPVHGGNQRKRCKKRFRLKNGKCVKKHKKHQKRQRSASQGRGGSR
jgi:hypothetical protein